MSTLQKLTTLKKGMNRKLIISLLLLLALAIIALVVLDLRRSRTDRRPDNPYNLDLEEFSAVDSSLIGYRETLNIKLDTTTKKGIAFGDGKILLVGNDYLLVITPDGERVGKTILPESPSCITVLYPDIYIGFSNAIRVYDPSGNEKASWPVEGDSSLLTSLAVGDSFLYAADAGNRRVLRYRTDGAFLGAFEGRRESADLHGFIIPSGWFDLALASDGELWIVNPGRHALENYTPEGRLRGYWEKGSTGIDGFSGCCGPAHIAMLPDGSFVTSEKGIVRIKVHRQSGDLDCVVAPPASFKNGYYAPDLTVGERGEIYALDFDRQRIRIFERRER